MKKRFWPAFFAVLMLLNISPLFSSALDEPYHIAKTSVYNKLVAGEIVQFPVVLDANAGYKLTVTRFVWDNTAFTLDSIDYNDELCKCSPTPDPYTDEGKYAMWSSVGEYSGTGTMATLNFKIKDTAKAGKYKIDLHEGFYNNKDENGVYIAELSSSEDGYITLYTDDKAVCFEADDVASDLVAGSEVRVPVRATQNTGFVAGVLNISWNKDALELKDVIYKGAPKDNPADITNSGKYRLSFGNTLKTTEYTGTGEFFTLVFKVTSAATAGKYDIGLDSFTIVNNAPEKVYGSLKNGSVELKEPTTTTTSTTTTTATTTTTTTTETTTTMTTTTTQAIASVKISKIGIDDIPVSGAVLKLTGIKSDNITPITFTADSIQLGSDGTLVNAAGDSLVWITGQEAAIVFAEDGTYTLTEVIAPTGYLIAPSARFIVIGGKTVFNSAVVDTIIMVDEKETIETTTTTTTVTTTTASTTTTTTTAKPATTTANPTTTTVAPTTTSTAKPTTTTAKPTTIATTTTKFATTTTKPTTTTSKSTTTVKPATTTAKPATTTAVTTTTTTEQITTTTYKPATTTTEPVTTTTDTPITTTKPVETQPVTTTESGSGETLPSGIGDINRDGVVDSSDASEALMIYAQVSTGGDDAPADIKVIADINADDLIDSSDASLILEYYAYVSTGGSDTADVYFSKEQEIT